MSANERIRVMIVDDHSIVRVGLKQVLEQSGEFEVVGEAADGEEAVRVAADVSPDVVVMDVIMPKKDGVEACRDDHGVRARDPRGHVDGLDGGGRHCGGRGRRRHRIPPRRRRTGSDCCQPCGTRSRASLRVPVEVVRRAFEKIRGGGRAGRCRRRTDSEGAGDSRLGLPGVCPTLG